MRPVLAVRLSGCLVLAQGFVTPLSAQVPDNLVVEGVPAIPRELVADAGRFLEFRAASFQSWHPVRRELLITTRFADTAQLHLVKTPGGARRQLTFGVEPVAGGSFHPKSGGFIVLGQDTGGGEFYQLYRHDLSDGKRTLLTDGKSRNSGPRWSHDGTRIAYTSTRRNGRDTDVYVINPADPQSNRLLCEMTGGGWRVDDWSPDDAKVLLGEYISINESRLWLADAKTGVKERLSPESGEEKVAYGDGRFARDGQAVFFTTDKGAEFQRLVRMDLADRKETVLTPELKWDVESFELSRDGAHIAFVTNEDGMGVLHLLAVQSGRELPAPKLPAGTVSNLEWHENSRDLAFNLSSAKAPLDVFSVDVMTGKVDRWTESETGGLNPENFVEPELVKIKSFDGLSISGFLYRPDAEKFTGKRPVVISIHGGPEGQSRPGFQARNNYFLSELGIAILQPNVRGSSGHGKTFLTLDNGLKREDSVKDIGAFIDWIRGDPGLDGARIAVTGASYGGFMTLASMTHFNDRLRCGVDIVGISNFATFLERTEAYRRDLRRVEYGDERLPEMREFFERTAPLNNVKKISKPMFIVQGLNDPRVPATEAEQMVKALHVQGATAWFLMARDEGHGFAKKKNADFQFLATILFYREHLLK
jgi:dipeptidyl aminopeptidase/acylaminoacyl peptidase